MMITYQASRITHHTSHITNQTSRITHHTSPILQLSSRTEPTERRNCRRVAPNGTRDTRSKCKNNLHCNAERGLNNNKALWCNNVNFDDDKPEKLRRLEGQRGRCCRRWQFRRHLMATTLRNCTPAKIRAVNANRPKRRMQMLTTARRGRHLEESGPSGLPRGARRI